VQFNSRRSPKNELSNIAIKDQSESQNRLPESFMNILQDMDDSEVSPECRAWTLICGHIGRPPRSSKNAKPVSGGGPQRDYEFGVLESYSALRHCGFITPPSNLQVILVRDELARAGLPDDILSSSVDDTRLNVQFVLQEIASEPIAVFEAIDLLFIK
jgi:hypothetical protein